MAQDSRPRIETRYSNGEVMFDHMSLEKTLKTSTPPPVKKVDKRVTQPKRTVYDDTKSSSVDLSDRFDHRRPPRHVEDSKMSRPGGTGSGAEDRPPRFRRVDHEQKQQPPYQQHHQQQRQQHGRYQSHHGGGRQHSQYDHRRDRDRDRHNHNRDRRGDRRMGGRGGYHRGGGGGGHHGHGGGGQGHYGGGSRGGGGGVHHAGGRRDDPHGWYSKAVANEFQRYYAEQQLLSLGLSQSLAYRSVMNQMRRPTRGYHHDIGRMRPMPHAPQMMDPYAARHSASYGAPVEDSLYMPYPEISDMMAYDGYDRGGERARERERERERKYYERRERERRERERADEADDESSSGSSGSEEDEDDEEEDDDRKVHSDDERSNGRKRPATPKLDLKLLKARFESVFNPDKIMTNDYLRGLMDTEDGYVKIRFLLRFKRIIKSFDLKVAKKITVENVVDALKDSETLEIDESKRRVRRRTDWKKYLLDPDSESIPKRSLEAMAMKIEDRWKKQQKLPSPSKKP